MKLTVQPVEWSPRAAEVLAEVGNPEDYARQVKAGAVLFRVSDAAGGEVGYYLLRVDELVAGAEGVLVAAVGSADEDLTAGLLPVIEKQFVGCRSIRIHTRRPGLARKLSRAGWDGAEIVMRKAL